MTATGLSITTFEFPHDVNSPSDFRQVPTNLSFNFQQKGNVRSLSTSYVSQQDLTGFLYVPTLSDNTACVNASLPYLPQNVTRQSDLSPRNSLVAIAPWVSPACTLSYLNAAPPNLTSAFIFFLPDQYAYFPPEDDAAWSLGDNGQWRTVSSFPVYAIATGVGEMLVEQMSHYSGHVATVPYGEELITRGYPPDAYVRLYVDLRTGGGSGLPSIWVFLLIILAILLSLIGVLSLAMHLLQRRRRNALRDRIASGDVHADILGMGRLTVPQDMVQKLPLYVYSSTPEEATVGKSTSQALPPLHQPTCAICLDDFVPSTSRVRELPCRHIFHPECIDLFLHDSSSLCPLCKKSVLPQGYCPTKITNAMVRRERHMRRVNARRARQTQSDGTTTHRERRRFSTPFTRRSSQPNQNAASSLPSVELSTVHAAPAQPPSSDRREWARRRALSMLGPRPAASGIEEEPTPSRMRKIWRNVFPGV